MRTKQIKGFTLIELLVVISIIGLLSSIVLVAMNNSREKARTAKTTADLNTFAKIAQVAQMESGKYMGQITGNWWSEQYCITGSPNLKNVSTSDNAYINWLNVLTTVESAANGLVSGITKLTRDAWGSPYCIDENEREFNPNDCRNDVICSPGSDGFRGTADDICINLPLAKTPCP